MMDPGTNGGPRVTLEMDGRRLSAPAGSYLLAVARGAGIEIPTLCDDPALEPVGACRLCMVEVSHPDWQGWSGLMTACLYPVAQGLVVSTRSPAVLQARRQVLSLLAASCPNSETIRELARRHGADPAGLAMDPEADDCILCGLCTRLCQTYVTSAITTHGRGAVKAIGTFAGEPAAECVGCGGCAMICPTGHIRAERTPAAYRIWGRDFAPDLALVERTRCTGCGSCEEACPFAVARVALSPDGRRVATIPAEHCRGCGACVGACPSGAIDQLGFEAEGLRERLGQEPTPVLACTRSDLARRRLPDGVELLELPCTGRVGGSLLLAGLAQGARGILVLGRHQESCRLNGAEDPVRERVERTRAALTLAGLEPERLAFEVPEPGPEGPQRAVAAFAERTAGLEVLTGNGTPPAELWQGEGLDSDLGLLHWLSQRAPRDPDAAAWLAAHHLPAPTPGGPLLWAGSLPYLDALAAPLLLPTSLPAVLRAAVEVLEALGRPGVGLVVGGCGPPAPESAGLFEGARAVYALSESDAAELAAIGVEAQPMEQLLLERSSELPRPVGARPVACASPEEERLVKALGHSALDLGSDPLPARFRLSPLERVAAEEHLFAADRHGAPALLVPEPLTLVRWAAVTRLGTWRSSRVLPVMAFQLAHLALGGRDLSTRELENPSRPVALTAGAGA